MELIGIDDKLLCAIKGMYRSLRRRFKIGRFVGEAFRSTNGILQGCPLSVMLLNALMMVLSRALASGVGKESFVDDFTLLSLVGTHPVLQEALDLLATFMELTDQKVNESKTVTFGVGAPPVLYYKGAPLPSEDVVKILGVKLRFTATGIDLHTEIDKVTAGVHLLQRIRGSDLTLHQRSLLSSALVMSKIFYGTEVLDFPEDQERLLRPALVSCLWGRKASIGRNSGLLLTMLVKGHVLDPAQAPHVRRLCFLRRCLANRPELYADLCEVWAGRLRRRRLRGRGFVENLLYTVKRLRAELGPGFLEED